MRKGFRQSLKTLSLNLSLTLVSVSLVMGSLEIGLRWFGSHSGDWYASGPQRLRFFRDHVRLNGDRFRDREFTPDPPSGVKRILALGDSFTFGDGIEQVENTWPRVLEKELAAYGGSYEVLNLGIPGTNTAFQRNLLRERGYRLHPDGIVVGFVLNDPEPPGANREIIPRELHPPLLPFPALDGHLTRSSYAYAWLRTAKNRLLERLGLKITYGEYVHGLYEDGEGWESFVREAEGLILDCRQREIPVAVAIFPMFHGLESYEFHEEHRKAAAVFRSAGAHVLDLIGLFEGHTSMGLRVSPTNAHPNERAHRLAAEAIARLVRQAGM